MKRLICSIHDSKAEAWMTPLVFQAKGQAVRSFSDAVNRGDGDFYLHPEDFTLYVVGFFDELSGAIEGCSAELLGNGMNYKINGDVKE